MGFREIVEGELRGGPHFGWAEEDEFYATL